MDNPLPIEIIFNLLCVCRRLDGDSPRSRRRAMLRRGLYYGAYDDAANLGFWVRLCQAAALLDEGNPPRPTLYCSDWLALSQHEQYITLLEAWQQMPVNPDKQRSRKRLLHHLFNALDINPFLQRELPGLQALGFCEDDTLTLWGQWFLQGELREIDPSPARPWQIVDQELHIPYPPDWHSLWNLEFYLAPIDPGIYPVDEQALRLAAQREAANGSLSFLQVVEQGLGSLLPVEFIAQYEMQPTIKVSSGVLLEFCSTEELANLRQNAAWRRDLSAILSPHHVFVNGWSESRVLARLQRAGRLSGRDISAIDRQNPLSESCFSRSESAYLLSIMLINDGLNSSLSAPPGLLAKLADNLSLKLRAAAARKAQKALDELLPAPAWVPEKELPPIPEPYLIAVLEDAIKKQLPVDITYQKAAQYQAEPRRVSPLTVEQRGLRFYLIAYCHSRRATRTFRIDRLRLFDAPPVCSPDVE